MGYEMALLMVQSANVIVIKTLVSDEKMDVRHVCLCLFHVSLIISDLHA